jgi:hypothetical protein
LILTVEVGGLVRITPVPGWLRHPNASRTLRDAAPTAAESDPPSRRQRGGIKHPNRRGTRDSPPPRMRNWLTDCRPSLVNRPTCNQMKGQTSARPPIPKRAGANMRPVPTRWRGEPGRAGGCAQDGPDGRPECLDSNSDGRQASGAISDSILWSRANDLGGSRSCTSENRANGSFPPKQ